MVCITKVHMLKVGPSLEVLCYNGQNFKDWVLVKTGDHRWINVYFTVIGNVSCHYVPSSQNGLF